MFGFQVIAGPPAKLKILKFGHSEVGMKNTCLGRSVSMFHVQILNTEFNERVPNPLKERPIDAWSPT